MERVAVGIVRGLAGAEQDALPAADFVALDEPKGVLPGPGVADTPFHFFLIGLFCECACATNGLKGSF